MDFDRDVIITPAVDRVGDYYYVMCSDPLKLFRNKMTGKHYPQLAQVCDLVHPENIEYDFSLLMAQYDIVEDINYD